MGRYKIALKQTAHNALIKISRSGDQATITRIEKIFHELELHPTTGTGKPEQLRYELSGCWSRWINRKDKLIYVCMLSGLTFFA
ncbi:MAG TPA: type II toxin-antitoxin system mRNA interferase toxin, RelE/StbE family [Bacteroidales bacterium]|nr:type II toxin-antitoxin system mRNA interferase toxin, RelE/StbE family [Bacteroidales bacterium]